MRIINLLILIALSIIIEAKTVYFDGENGDTNAWITLDNGVIQNVYDEDLNSRVVSLSPGTYDIGLGDRSWNNTEERVLSWDMKITDAYTIYVSVDTLQGHRWLFYNALNVDIGFHGAGILNGIGNNKNNGKWHRVTIDLDRDLKDTEPNNEIIRVNGMRFGGVLGSIDNIALDNPKRDIYETGNRGISKWIISDNTPDGAKIELIAQDSDNDETRENVIKLSGTEQENSFTIGGTNSDNGWNNRQDNMLQLKMKNANLFTITVHVQTQNGYRELVYTPSTADIGISSDGVQIHHGMPVSRNGDNAENALGTDNLWQTYTVDLEDDLKDYEPNNELIAVNGLTIRGDTLVDDIKLFSSLERESAPKQAPTVYEDAEDGTINGWSIREGSQGDIVNVMDTVSGSRVIQLLGGGSYILGALGGDDAWHNTTQKTISWKMRTDIAYTIYVVVNTRNGLRYLFYTISPNRGLKHGFVGGIHHGLGSATISGRWRTVTRDLEKDLKDAEPDNELLEVNGFIYNGGNNGMIDDIILYNQDETTLEDGESGTWKWGVSDNIPDGANILNIEDNDMQGRNTQGNIISLSGNGFDNAYIIGGADSEDGWDISDKNIFQWRFRNFGPVEVLEEREIIRDPNAFEFRIFVETQNGKRELIYTLGADNLGLVESGTTIHHGLGDDRIKGSVWAGDDPMNELGLWQTVTRDLQEDIWDFEPNNRLLKVNGFQVRNSGYVDGIKMLSYANVDTNSVETSTDNNTNLEEDNDEEDINITILEDAEDGTTDGWSVYVNTSESATVSNITDDTKNSRVIELRGDGKADAYRFNFEDRQEHNIRWSMNYNEDYTVYVVVNTTNGIRYLTYTPIDENRGLSNAYILIGLGSNSNNGTWQTFTRDLQADIANFEDGNEFISIDSVIVRGSGRLDDIGVF